MRARERAHRSDGGRAQTDAWGGAWPRKGGQAGLRPRPRADVLRNVEKSKAFLGERNRLRVEDIEKLPRGLCAFEAFPGKDVPEGLHLPETLGGARGEDQMAYSFNR